MIEENELKITEEGNISIIYLGEKAVGYIEHDLAEVACFVLESLDDNLKDKIYKLAYSYKHADVEDDFVTNDCLTEEELFFILS